ncbi:hypothetical protein [Aneurinibacillus aneurinilyticus]|uniref:Uncharacterized protein n=1 Tax=Aneurinibacillus aneurinilyticus ATCC 12856 TaxID=649747 RepID=U1X774_ANEAE|nr:hypothetical protein [Aneurinibacillus aneurinilyticus]ERI10805.1 hypothetical protein HMPREF0083_01061 [Aneurinibacillus aneurinilyticus ATCC 12856]MED0705896.1 hypothetical protein [Aneurinibacillus aneurinilyticus]MED0722715.1 hypothetical protein [Aneurinibacillus aneurinilyticus]MED0731365.1 hypothetical protein [Aneurinibacillus aneurinilyticus]MED0740121.1 hypothetical protein [Aneurinibacillus aneurinilyticus]
MEMVNSGTLYFSGRPVMDVLDDFLKPREAEVYTPPKPTRKVPVVVVVDTKKIQLQILQRIAERTRKRRIKRKVTNRISQMEQWS